MKKSLLSLVPGLLTTCGADAAIFIVSQDGFIDQGNPVLDGGTGTRLNVATPNPSGASNYTQKAYFGFNVTGIDLSQVTSATFNVTAASNIGASYNGQSAYRFYLVSNLITDSFNETTLDSTNAPGQQAGDVITAQRTTGTIIGDVNLANPAAGQVISVSFSAAALADLLNDSNSFLTIVAEYRGQNNAGYQLSGTTATGVGFNSKESVSGGATLDLVPEPSVTLLGGLSALALLRRRRTDS